jgi:hypothetical protein
MHHAHDRIRFKEIHRFLLTLCRAHAMSSATPGEDSFLGFSETNTFSECQVISGLLRQPTIHYRVHKCIQHTSPRTACGLC